MTDSGAGSSSGRGARRSGEETPGNLPAGVNTFLGREPVLAKLAGRLEGSRLVTLVGPPGIGKSRLGVELAHRVAGDYPGGAWLAELAPVSDGELVPAALAAAMSISEEPGRDLADTVVGRLGSGRVLVVLDNCEHLVDACAELCDALLRGCPELRIVVTSRETLSVAGEQVCPVAPLEVPPRGDALSDGDSGLAAASLGGYESVELFVERAQAAKPGFALDRDSAGAVGEICRRLDGIPLAIELAAARVAMLTAREIAGRLDDRFGLLIGGSRSHLPRHQTLQAAVDWSYDLLDSDERALLARLSVFAGGFTLEGAEAICAGEGKTRGEVLETLGGLVSKSLIGADTANSRGRYRMLETIRAYAADRLVERPDAPACAQAHARYYVDLAERAEPEFVGPHQEYWFERMEGERENVSEAIGWSVSQDRAEWALRLGGALVLFWRVRCHFSEGRRLLESALNVGPAAPPAVAAKARWGLSFLALMSGDDKTALSLAEDSLQAFRGLDQDEGCARSLLVIGFAKQGIGQSDWRSLLSDSASLARRAGDPWCQALALFSEGFALARAGDLPGARPLLDECLTVARSAGQRYILNYALIGLGNILLCQGEYQRAQDLLSEAAAGARELSDEYTQATALEYLGELALRRGEGSTAQGLLENALDVLPEGAPPYAILGPLTLLGSVAHADGDWARARVLFQKARSTANGTLTSWRALQGLATLDLENGDVEAARRGFEDALELARSGAQNDASAAAALFGLGEVAREVSDIKLSTTLHNEALALRRKISDAPGIVASIEALGSLALNSGEHERSIRLLGATQALRDARCYARSHREAERHIADTALIGEMLSPEHAATVLAEGARLSLSEASLLASRGRGRRGRPSSGWSSLTERQQQIAVLVAEGRTNPEIARRLLLSLATVKTQVSRIFPKLGVTSRSEIAEEVRRRQRESP